MMAGYSASWLAMEILPTSNTVVCGGALDASSFR
jgi:hypothetical protein